MGVLPRSYHTNWITSTFHYFVIFYNIWTFPASNRLLPSSKKPHFQNEAKCTTFLVKMSFICMRMKNQFYIKGWALNLVLIQRPRGNSEMAYYVAVTPTIRTSRASVAFLSTLSGRQRAVNLTVAKFSAETIMRWLFWENRKNGKAGPILNVCFTEVSFNRKSTSLCFALIW